MMKKRLVPAMFLLLLNTPAIFAQTKIYSLTEVWQQVLRSYPSLKAKKAAVDAQALRKELTRQGFLPEVTLQGQQNYGSAQTIPGSFFPLPGLYNISGSNKATEADVTGSSLFSSATLQWNFFQFGRQQKKLAIADAGLQLSNRLLQQEEWNLIAAASRLYFTALASEAAFESAASDSRRLLQLYDLLQAQAGAGLRPGADTLLLKASLLQSKAKQHDLAAQLKNRLLQLAALMGKADTAIALDNSIFHRFQTKSLNPTALFESHPYLQAMNARIAQAEAEKELVKKEPYPTVSLLAGAGLKGSGIDATGNNDKSFGASWQNAKGTYLAGIGLTWNFSSLYQNQTRRAIAGQVLAAARADKETVEVKLQSQYAAAFGAWNEQKLKLQAAQTALDASRQAYALYEVRYHSGLLSLIELLQLQKSLQEAESNYITAVATYWNELLNQAEALGDPALLLSLINPKP